MATLVILHAKLLAMPPPGFRETSDWVFFDAAQAPPSQHAYLGESRLLCQLLDGVAAIPQDALVTVDEGDPGDAGRCVDISAGGKHSSSARPAAKGTTQCPSCSPTSLSSAR